MIKIENAKHKAEYKTIADLAAVIWTSLENRYFS